jgi:hypothetical protein
MYKKELMKVLETSLQLKLNLLESKNKKTSEFRKKKRFNKLNNCVSMKLKNNEFRKKNVTILNNSVLQKSKDLELKKKNVIVLQKKLVWPKLKNLRLRKN